MSVLTIPKEDLKQIINLFNRKIGLFFVTVVGLYLDSASLAEKFPYNHILINILSIIGFYFLYKKSNPRTKKLMIYAVIISFFGEYFFSVYLGMYSYRLGNVPLYVPLGHAVVYARVFAFSKAAIVRKHHKKIESFFYGVCTLFALIYWFFFNDLFGLLMTLCVFLMLFNRPKDRVFFLSMYITVAVLEIGGTAYGCWKWPPIAFNIFAFLPSNNPPSGISLFYFLLDISCFFVYIVLHNKTWKRLKKINPSSY